MSTPWLPAVLQALVDDESVTDVLVNGADGVWADRGAGPVRVPADLGGEDAVRALAVRLAAGVGRRLDESRPWVDARLADGVRLHAVVPPVSPGGTHLSLRVLRPGRFGLDELVRAGAVPAAWRPLLEALVTARAALLVTGGTGTGKTTLLAALLSLVPAAERLVLVEDVCELRPRHPHVVRLEARHTNVEGRGEVTLTDLTRQALRMRPDRLVVGECRGAEVRDLLAALNTGHAGGSATLHANTAGDVPARLEALGGLAGMTPAAIALQAAAAFDAVLHLCRDARGRRLTEIGSLRRGPEGLLTVEPVAQWSGGGEPTVRQPGWDLLRARLDGETAHLP